MKIEQTYTLYLIKIQHQEQGSYPISTPLQYIFLPDTINMQALQLASQPNNHPYDLIIYLELFYLWYDISDTYIYILLTRSDLNNKILKDTPF